MNEEELRKEIDRLTAEREEIRSKMSDDAHASDMCAVAWMNRAEAAEEQRDALLQQNARLLAALTGCDCAHCQVTRRVLDEMFGTAWRAQPEGEGKG